MFNTDSIRKYSTENLDKQSVSFFEYMYVFVLIIYAGRANTFVESGSYTENPVGVLLPILLTVILAFRWNVKLDVYFYILIFGFSIYFVAISLKYNVIHPSFLVTYFVKFFTIYVVIKALNNNLFKIYERILYYLSIVGLFMWSIQVILGGDTLFSYFGKIPGIKAFSYVTGEGLNAIIYSVQPTSYSIISNMISRNSGFAQEPGSFAVYICLAIFINLFITKDAKNSNIRFWVLAVTLISTQSTTGYVIFMLILVYYILSKDLKQSPPIVPCCNCCANLCVHITLHD